MSVGPPGHLSGREYAEYPVCFTSARHEHYGIYAQPAAGRSEAAVLLLTGGGFIPMTHRNRLWVRLAHRLAAEGFPVLRFDYHGVGESTGDVTKFWLERPFVEDLEGAVNWLRRRGHTKIVLVGSCFGARTILAGAERVPELAGTVLMSVPVRVHGSEELEDVPARGGGGLGTLRRVARRHVMMRLLDPQWRGAYLRVARRILRGGKRRRPGGAAPPGADGVSALVLDPVRRLAHRRVPVLFLYGSIEEYFKEFQRAAGGELGDLVTAAEGRIQIRTVDGVLHGFSTVAVQHAAIEQTLRWICAIERPAQAQPAGQQH